MEMSAVKLSTAGDNRFAALIYVSCFRFLSPKILSCLALPVGAAYNVCMKSGFGLGCVLLAALILTACERESKNEPQTPQEMYEHAKALLKPNVEGDASDFEGALKWTRKAAEGNWLPAIMDMGALYMYGGKGVKQDIEAARKWYNKAVEMGSKEAHWFLGTLDYESSHHVESALKHWRIAAEAGVADAQYRLGRILSQKQETLSEGMQWLEKAARIGQKGGVPQACTALANLYMTGANGAPADTAKAVQLYKVASGGGDPLAQLVYAELLLAGADGVPQDTEKGMSMLRLAAGQDYPRAIARLINILRNGPDAEQHEKEAAAWSDRLNRLQSQPKK